MTSHRTRITALALASFATLSTLGTAAHATTYTLTAADRTEIEQLLRRFFEAARDGNETVLRTVLPTGPELQALFVSGASMVMASHQRAVERDVRELRLRFAGGVWVGLSGTFATARTVELRTCGRFSTPQSECTLGPVIDWRANGSVQHLRIDSLVRINGHWRIYDPRL